MSLAVCPGEVHALVGESGAGKSMVARAVFGILPRTVDIVEGQVMLADQDLTLLPETARRLYIGKRAAFIPQDPLTALNPAKRIERQICDRLIHILGMRPADARARALGLLAEVKMAEPGRHQASQSDAHGAGDGREHHRGALLHRARRGVVGADAGTRRGAIAGGYGGAHIGKRLPATMVRIITLAVAVAITAAFFYRAYLR